MVRRCSVQLSKKCTSFIIKLFAMMHNATLRLVHRRREWQRSLTDMYPCVPFDAILAYTFGTRRDVLNKELR